MASDGSPSHLKSTIPNIVPKKVHEYLEKYQGATTTSCHMSRSGTCSVSGRSWLKRMARPPRSAGRRPERLEFLVCTRDDQHLTDRWGTEPVTNDPDGDKVQDVLKGWTTDQQ